MRLLGKLSPTLLLNNYIVTEAERTKKLLTTYLRRLTNLSGNNRSLFLPRLSEQVIDLHSLSQLNREKSFGIIDALIAGKKKILCAILDSRMEAVNEASRKLKKLQRVDHFLFEERGSKDLHVGWPFVRGKFSDGTLVRCPLLYFPVELAIENKEWVIRIREGEDVVINKSFLLAYSFYNKVKADEELLEETFDDIDRDSTAFRTALYQLFEKSSVELNFNSDNYQDELTDFITYKKDEFEDQHQIGELKLFPEAVLGIFPQAGSYLVPDYLDLLENQKINDLEEFFEERTTVEKSNDVHDLNFIHRIKEEKIYSTFPMDAWQENALKSVKLGNSLVVEGPPGTGKSQLICNLISDAIAAGKRVLVVCQKRAALDVVYARMKEQDFSDYLALIHDFKNDRRGIYEKVSRQIERVNEYKTRNNSTDVIQLERRFLTSSHRINQIIEELEEFKKSLFDDRECGASVKELYLRSDPSAPAINMKQEYQNFRFDDLETFLRKLQTYTHYAQRFKTDDYAWRDRKSFSKLGTADLQKMVQIVEEIPVFFSSLSSRLAESFGVSLGLLECTLLVEKESLISEVHRLTQDQNAYRYFQSMINENESETSELWLNNTARVILDCFLDEGPETSVSSDQLGEFQKALHRSLQARQKFLGLIRWHLFSKDKMLINRALIANNLINDEEGLKRLEKKLDARLNLEHNLSKIKTKSWLVDIPKGYRKQEYENWFTNQRQAIKAKQIYCSIWGLKNLIHPAKVSKEEFTSRLDFLFKTLSSLHEKMNQWEIYITPGMLRSLTETSELAALLSIRLKEDFDSLSEFDKLEETINPDERAIINKLHEEVGRWDEQAFKILFLNSLCLGWIDHLELKYPVLRMVSSEKCSLLERELREQIEEKEIVSNEILLMRARENVVDDLEFNRLNNRITYRDLLHQTTKKKKIWPVRKLVTEFENEIFRLLPCWLASPESVSAIFPMKEMFDIVIFDEASQCFAERGIPAMYRAKQVVVAGDSRQLRPGDLYQVRWQEEESDDVNLEVESLLDLAGRYFQKVQLNGHYRSQALELIDFSNRHFYEGQLRLLPDQRNINNKQSAIHFHKVSGLWENNINTTEAETVANLVLSLHREFPSKTIGVITFNAPQQNHILDVLEDKFQLLQTTIPESLFVKNIENVQGDERDIIIFSIGYAPDKKGKLAMQFGSLNSAGGENRLNVAVTRAREQIIIVSSIWPEELRTEDAKNAGPRLLKEYLSYARDAAQGDFKPYMGTKRRRSDWYLKEHIKHWSENRFPQTKLEDDCLPFADLSVKKDGQYTGLILTDDDLYYESLSARSIHASIPFILESKHWGFTIVFSRNFWKDRDKFFNEVSKFMITS
ncbi:MAG TPA: AAA domain-containing protein [Cyclobacteriaceae bacterium]|nr:AAA domain-containing protein [Cyclobacteriaceae bacterium]